MTVQEEIRQRIERDPLLARLRRKIDSGNATFADTSAYNNRAAEILGDVFSRRLPSISPAEREAICVDLLQERYSDINSLLDRVQRSLDAVIGLQLAPQHAPFNSERAHQIGRSLSDPTVSEETQQRRARSAPATATRAMHDDRMMTEAKFRSNAGLKCYINREAVPGCCDWCTKMAGRYTYGSEPGDVYRRHDNCGCSVTYENGRQRQDVWSKRTWEAPGRDAGADEPVRLTEEQAAAAGAGEPVSLTREQAAATGAGEPVRYNRSQSTASSERLTDDNESGRIESRTYTPATQQEIQQFVTNMQSLGFKSVTGFEQFTERASLLQEITEDFSKVHVDFPEVFPSIHLSFGKLAKDVYAEYNTKTKIITLNSLFYNDLDYYKSDYNHEVNKKFHPVGTDYRATIPHEFGHAVEDYYGIHLKQLAQQIYSETHDGFFNRKLGDEWIRNGLCTYASLGHYGDLIAESFAEYYNSKSSRDLCKLIFDHVIDIRRDLK